jgi:hypothetical protein
MEAKALAMKRFVLSYPAARLDFDALTLEARVTDKAPQCDSNYEQLHASNRADWKFELTGELYLIGNTFMQTWFFGKGVEGVEGWSVITVNARGEVISLHGVVEETRNHSVQQEDEPANPPPVVALGCWRAGPSSSMDGYGGSNLAAPGRYAAA